MKNYLRSSLKVTLSYLTSLVFFVVLLPALFFIAKKFWADWDKSLEIIHYYSFFVFIAAFYIVYENIRQMCEIEKGVSKDIYPLKGLVYGILGFLPYILVIGLIYYLPMGSGADRIKHVAINTILGPLYFIVRLGKESLISYIAASVVIPFTAALGYMAGYYDFKVAKLLKGGSQ
ncbi:MAG: hypothetical protein N2645_04200 [Clostridia bacterium]|nr:hypothetical protein [Clostridia bacterium]